MRSDCGVSSLGDEGVYVPSYIKDKFKKKNISIKEILLVLKKRIKIYSKAKNSPHTTQISSYKCVFIVFPKKLDVKIYNVELMKCTHHKIIGMQLGTLGVLFNDLKFVNALVQLIQDCTNSVHS